MTKCVILQGLKIGTWWTKMRAPSAPNNSRHCSSRNCTKTRNLIPLTNHGGSRQINSFSKIRIWAKLRTNKTSSEWARRKARGSRRQPMWHWSSSKVWGCLRRRPWGRTTTKLVRMLNKPTRDFAVKTTESEANRRCRGARWARWFRIVGQSKSAHYGSKALARIRRTTRSTIPVNHVIWRILTHTRTALTSRTFP